ncbi:hypothetical protein GUJ93_ZPchr0010g10039 [Zizania palustris]|uniref:Uncharacterized protein n=1 Tax=Zizania palustris TaxID=103762 RepID=A0A8J5WE25_ZIZPA|nr:hypothetical protein GUJ93_ZPchr0010g10039 [Zizania palustris]
MTPSSFVAVMAALESITRPLLATGRIERRGHLRKHVELRVEGVERPVLLERDVAGDAATAEGQWNILNVIHQDNNYFPITLVTYVTPSVAPLSVDSVVLSDSDDFNEDICHGMRQILSSPMTGDNLVSEISGSSTTMNSQSGTRSGSTIDDMLKAIMQRLDVIEEMLQPL